MTRTATETEGDESANGIAVLLVVDEQPVRDAIVAYARRHTDIRISTAASGPAARDRVAVEPLDCVVADPDALAGDGAQFVADIRAAVPDCPVIWLTRRDSGTIDDRVLTVATTIVEQGDDPGEWAFLVEKIRGAVRSASAARDGELYKHLVETARDGLYRLDANAELAYCNESFAAMLGYNRAELIGSHASRVMAPGELERGQQLIQQVMQTEDRESDLVEMDWTTKAGDHITVAVHFVVLTAADGTYDGVMGVARDVTERKRREQAVEALHEATREMMRAPDRQRVADCAVETAKDVLGLPLPCLWMHEPAHDQLRPAAWTTDVTEVVGDPPTFSAGEPSLAREVFEAGEAQIFPDLHEQPGRYNPETPIRSEIIVPLGDHGVLSIGATTRESFDEADLMLASLLAANTEAAFDRIERTQALRERTEQLARQNDRLEEFASVVSHDLRNPLNTAQGCVDLVRTECDSEHLDATARALDRMETLIAETLTLARQGRTVESPEPVGLDALIAEAWTTVAPAGTLEVDFDDVTVLADPDRLQQVFENLFRNAAEHAGPDVTVRVGLLADGRGFYVADDGPGIPKAERDTVFDHGHTTSDDGTGFGLSIVRSIVQAHGWDIEVTESAPGGARFDITGVDRP